ncbi:MAG: vWA domain-containing protein [Candidatus Binataceae bacterium]
MGLLHPGALGFLALVPALVLAYLARERAARVTVSSVLAFRALRGFKRERFFGRPRLDWKFFAEAAILALAALAMAEPYVLRESNPIVAVLDNSAAMRALVPTGKTRFDTARAKLDAMLSAEAGGGSVSVYVTAPRPERIAPPFDSIAAARRAIQKLKPSGAPDDLAALTNFLSGLAADAHAGTVIFAGANAIAAPIPPRIHAIAVGDSAANAGIGSFTLRREAFGASALRAQLTIGNFSAESRTVEAVVTGDGRELAHARATLGPGAASAIEFPALPPARIYRAELKPDDALALDNVAYAAAGAVRAVSILFVSPTPADASGLSSIPGVRVIVRTPDTYTPDDLAGADLAIFEYSVPKELPAVNTMLAMPPPGDPVFGIGVVPDTQVRIADWRKIDPLTDSVNFRLLDLRGGEYFRAHPWMSAIVTGDGGALMLAGQRGGHRFVATGFNPFPYLGKRNLPMSILTLNVLGYLAGVGASEAGYRTGQPWIVPAGVVRVILPSGKQVAAEPGTLFTEAAEQGVYELESADGKTILRAVNLADFSVSDLERTPPLRIEAANAPAVHPVIEKFPLADYLLAAIIALCLLEALIVYRRRKSPYDAAQDAYRDAA